MSGPLHYIDSEVHKYILAHSKNYITFYFNPNTSSFYNVLEVRKDLTHTPLYTGLNGEGWRRYLYRVPVVNLLGNGDESLVFIRAEGPARVYRMRITYFLQFLLLHIQGQLPYPPIQ